MPPIIYGKDFNYFRKVQVTDGYFSYNYDVAFNFRGLVSFSLVNESPDDSIIQYSFNGTTVHGDLVPGMPSQAVFFDNRRAGKIWFRLAPGEPSGIVRVEGWASS